MTTAEIAMKLYKNNNYSITLPTRTHLTLQREFYNPPHTQSHYIPSLCNIFGSSEFNTVLDKRFFHINHF